MTLKPTERPPISAVMALEALREQSALVTEAEEKLSSYRRTRNDLIRAAREANIPYATISKATGLGRDRLIDIAHSAPSA